MTFGRVAEALPRAIRLVGWPKLVIFFFFYLDGPVSAAADLAPAEWHMLQHCHRIRVHVL